MSTLTHDVPVFSVGDHHLRHLRPDDIEKVFAGLSDPRVIAHYGVSYDSLAATRAQMQWFDHLLATGEGIWWALAQKSDDALIGACGLNDHDHTHRRAEIGYWLLPPYWRQGLMRRALPHVLTYGFEQLGIHRIHADVEPENEASVRLLRAMGFTHEGTLRDVEYKNGRYLSLHQFSLLATDEAAVEIMAHVNQ